MKLKRISWKNFNAYGNEINTINFDDEWSLNLISGKNGSGKSTICEVIIFGLYGGLPLKRNKDIVNRINKNLEVQIEFDSRGRNVKIIRGLEPNIFEIFVDNNKQISDIAGKRNVQEILNEMIGIPYNVFNNLITLDINKYISFVKMNSKEKRDIIDKIFGFEDINKMYGFLKDEIKANKRQIDDFNSKIEWVNTQNKKILDEITESLNEHKLIDKSKVNEYILKIEKYQTFLDKSKEIFDINKEQLERISKEEKTYSKKIIVSKTEMRDLRGQISLFDNDQCPTCGTNFNTTEFLEVKNKIEEQLLEKQTALDAVVLKLKEVEYEKEEILESHQTLLKKEKEILIKTTKLKSEIDKLKDLNSQKIDLLKDKSKNFKVDIDNLLKELKVQQEDRHFLNTMDSILNEDGFKKTVLKTLIPSFNTQIQVFSKILNLSYFVEMNEHLDIKIQHFGRDIEVRTLSTGENKKLDLVVIFSLISLIKLKFSNINILFLDEVFSSLDLGTQNHVIDILSKLVEKLKIHAFVINHSDLVLNLFTNIIEINKKNQFSEIEIKKNV